MNIAPNVKVAKLLRSFICSLPSDQKRFVQSTIGTYGPFE
jgi:hypothetical protein